MEQRLLDRFLDEVWNESIFETECSGLRYDAHKTIMVYPKVAYTLMPYDVLSLSVDEKARLLASPPPPPKPTPLTLALRSNLKITEAVTFPSREDGYLLRFSSRLVIGDSTYVQLWIKSEEKSSGARVTLHVSPESEALDVWAQTCDDWG